MSFDAWEAMRGARFAKGDPLYREWAAGDAELYATNGAGLALITRSAPERALPDLFCMALLARFSGYPRLRLGHGGQAQLPELGHPQGAHAEPGRGGDVGVGRPARPAAGQLPLLSRTATTRPARTSIRWSAASA